MFDRTEFINSVLNVRESEKPQVMIPEVLDALNVKINYAKSKKLRAIVDTNGKIVCKSKKGGVILKTKKASAKINLLINEDILTGLVKSKNGIITLKTIDNTILATYYNKQTSKIAKKLKLMGKYGVEDKFGVSPDDQVEIQTTEEFNQIIKALNTINTKEKHAKVLAKK